MRILLIHQYFLEDNDGGGSRWNEMSRVWQQAGHEVTVLAGMVHYMGHRPARYAGRYTLVERNTDGIKVVRCHVSESYNASFLGRLWAYFSFTFSSIWGGLRHTNGKYDVILVTSPPLFVGITAYVLSTLKRTPFVFEIRDLWPESAIDTGVLTNKLLIKFAFWFESFLYRKAQLINVLTPAFREKLILEKGVPAQKIIFIPNAADFSLSEKLLNTFDSAAFRKTQGLNDKFVVTYVGAHGVANHLVQVLDTAALLQDTNVLFLLIGDGMLKKELKEDAQRRGLPNVRFIDSVPKSEVFKYILASDMGASVLKKVDTFKTVYSNKTFDYMSCRKPILMAIDGVSRELVEAADAGVFVEPENAADFAAKIRYYLANPAQVIAQGNNGYQYAKAHFDRVALAKRYLDHLK
ncbi:MAG: glycosyltransferase WbuB [Runella slithyformis]|nr:MAG: glycosyltransferase WbuB [Runella slithyformis]TAF24900.1 MAG: glycosyltransferase WbuB [Runella slithyformis]TAF48863.1 MAG: glycosyltransferase WbuB [Runella slithyformis]TAF79758.1 MAG: glycosyltransferase WbuB [Runella slithyformis]TAH10075.1 MAG: glycosyltransferase WbuB [Runella slithyformis]